MELTLNDVKIVPPIRPGNAPTEGVIALLTGAVLSIEHSDGVVFVGLPLRSDTVVERHALDVLLK